MLRELKEIIDDVKEPDGKELLNSTVQSGMEVLADIVDLVEKDPNYNKMAVSVASMSKRMYNAFIAGGFTSDEALKLTCAALNRK